jgi:hypothetical protein
MTATNHAITGAVIAGLIRNPAIAIPVAFATHFAMDALPHFGLDEEDVFKRNKDKIFRLILAGDVCLAALALIATPIFLRDTLSAWIVVACMFACMSPDLIWGWHFYHEIKSRKIRVKKWFSKFHLWVQWSQLPKGAFVEIAWLGLFIFFITLIKT